MHTDPERRPLAGEAPDRSTAVPAVGRPGAGLTVAVLMCTYQGAVHLVEQLESIGAQTHPHWKLWVSDDGSTDDTLAILQRYRERWGAERLEILQGPRAGSMANFLTLTCNPAIEADCFAWADQDDLWEADKLARAVAWMASKGSDTAALYGTRTQLVDAAGQPLGLSPLFTRPPSFQNALVQSIAGGNTMLFNAAARNILMKVGANINALAHDWWIYIVVTACGGRVHYDPWPSVRYRQHSRNQYGTNLGFSARWLRMRLLLGGSSGSGWTTTSPRCSRCMRRCRQRPCARSTHSARRDRLACWPDWSDSGRPAFTARPCWRTWASRSRRSATASEGRGPSGRDAGVNASEEVHRFCLSTSFF